MGNGFVCDMGGQAACSHGFLTPVSPGKWTTASTNQTDQEVTLSPSPLAWGSSITMASKSHGTSSKAPGTAATTDKGAVRGPLSYPTYPGTGGGDTTMALGVSTIRPPSRPPTPPADGRSGRWGMFIITPDQAQWYVPPYPGNGTKHHIEVAACQTVCPRVNMPPTCSGYVTVSQAQGDALATGAPFSCTVVPVGHGTSLHGAATHIARGTVHKVAWSLELHQGAGIAPLHLATPDPDLKYNMHMFAHVYNMFAGNVFGNIPASLVCLHEMS